MDNVPKTFQKIIIRYFCRSSFDSSKHESNFSALFFSREVAERSVYRLFKDFMELPSYIGKLDQNQ